MQQRSIARGVQPSGFDRVTAYIEPHLQHLAWMVCAWADDGRGHVIDYGYEDMPDDSGSAESIATGVGDLIETLSGRKAWLTQSGHAATLTLGLVDDGWVTSTLPVRQAIRDSRHGYRWMAAKGCGISAARKPMLLGEWNARPGERVGWHWVLTGDEPARVLYDTNWWKSDVTRRLADGRLTVCRHESAEDCEDCKVVRDHLAAEVAINTRGGGRIVQEWHHRAGRPDSHCFECLAGCAAAANVAGATAGQADEANQIASADASDRASKLLTMRSWSRTHVAWLDRPNRDGKFAWVAVHRDGSVTTTTALHAVEESGGWRSLQLREVIHDGGECLRDVYVELGEVRDDAEATKWVLRLRKLADRVRQRTQQPEGVEHAQG